MRIKRKKATKKAVLFAKMKLGFSPPFKVLVDDSFVRTAIKQKFHIVTQIADLLGEKVVPHISNCCVERLRAGGPEDYGAYATAKNFTRIRCEHEGTNSEKTDKGNSSSGKKDKGNAKCQEKDDPESKNSLPDGFRCVKKIINTENPDKFVVATQIRDLRDILQTNCPNTLCVYLNGPAAFLSTAPSARKERPDKKSAKTSSQDFAGKRIKEGDGPWQKKKKVAV